MSEKPERPQRYKEEKGDEKRREKEEKEDEKRKGWDEKWRRERVNSVSWAAGLIWAGLGLSVHRLWRPRKLELYLGNSTGCNRTRYTASCVWTSELNTL